MNKTNDKYHIITDSLGRFEIKSGLIGMVVCRPEFKLKIEKEGYKTRSIRKSGRVIVELKKKKIISPKFKNLY